MKPQLTNSKLKMQLIDMKKIWRDPILVCTIVLVIISLLLFIVLPLYKVLKQSVIATDGKLTLASYFKILSSTDTAKVFYNTMLLGVLVGVLSTVIGFIFAYADAYLKMKGKKIFNLIAILPIVSPPFVIALSAILLFGRSGLITRKLLGMTNANIYGLKGLLLVQTLTFFPVAYLLLAGLLKSIDPSMEEASRNMGASRWKTFTTVTLPLAIPGIANSFLLVFIQVVADFGNPMVIGGNFSTLATQIYLQAIGNYDMQGGATLAVLLLAVSTLLFVLSKYWIEKKSYVTVTGKPSRERGLIEEKHIVAPLSLFCLIASGLVIAFYILIPIGSFTKLWGINYDFTLDHYRYAWTVGKKAILDTTWLSLLSMPITGILGMIIAFLIVRKRFLGRGLIEFTSLLAMAIPGTVIGIGYILAYNTKPLVLTGTATILIIAFIFRSLPMGIRSGIASLQQIDPSIEEASADLGANAFKTFRSVTLPLIKPAFFSGLIYTFVRSMTAVSTVIFLVSSRYNLLTVTILGQVDVGKIGVASAFSTILILIVYAVIGILYFLLSKLGVSKSDIQM